MSDTASGQTNTVSSIGRELERRVFGTKRERGARRLGFAGFFLLGESLLTAWSLFLDGLGVRTFDFSSFGIQVDLHSGLFVLNDVTLPRLVALAVVLPVAIVGIAGGGRIWLGGPPRLALVAPTLWMIVAAGLGLAGGRLDLLVWHILLLLLILSGSWARRVPGTRPIELLRGGAVRPVGADD